MFPKNRKKGNDHVWDVVGFQSLRVFFVLRKLRGKGQRIFDKFMHFFYEPCKAFAFVG